MRLTTKGRYAVTAVLDLAFHQQTGPVSLADISERQAISLSYLEQLFSKLRKNDVVSSTRGPGGGYKLSNSPEDVSIVDIITAVDESYRANGCTSGEYCQGGVRCLTHDLWDELSDKIHGFLNGISLADLMQHKDTIEIACDQDKSLDLQKLSEQII
ncbi:MAG: Rrf2 family transcriptional regulator [Gammaproteobacteria bacterium]|nr:Rrf2 family transcriptional regulator [Gammaproteobacteria bacterium]